jgi:cell pole-organizing protein PopZ
LSQLSALGARDQLGSMPLGDAGRTLEDLVRELLRPMLRDWLDANLAQLVERLVQEEIRRMSRDAQRR